MARIQSPRMEDVARAAGVARSTVSMALRRDPSIPEATRQRILNVARRLGYRPNPLVAALMTTRRMQRPMDQHTVLAFVTSHPGSDSWRNYATFVRMHAGARTRAASIGFKLEEFPLHHEDMSPERFASMLQARGIHGLLIAPLPGHERILRLPLENFAVVGLGTSVSEPAIERVSNDHTQSMLLAMERCRALGYGRIGLVVSQETSERLEHRWLSGFFFAQQNHPVRERCKPLLPERAEQIADALPAWCARERPDVVLFGNYEPKHPYRLPAGTGLACLDVAKLDGDLTGIFQDDDRIGAIAVDHLVARLQRGELGVEDRPRLSLVAGLWAPGRTALGPGRNPA